MLLLFHFLSAIWQVFRKREFFFVQLTLIKKNSAIFFQILAKNFQFFCWKKLLELPSFVSQIPLSYQKKKKRKKKKERENSSITKVPAGRAMEKGEKWMKKKSSIHQLRKL
jgi:hypothetical protein